MDPQQRLLLEVVYEALEDAGITLDEIRGSRTAVFAGSFTYDYQYMMNRDLTCYPKYSITGNLAQTILANRVSFFFDLHGPSVQVDTACSSGLTALHLGCQSLLIGESDMAIICGTALHFDPTIFVTMSDFGMLSTDGRCRHFDADGSGYVRGDGICAVIVKREKDAKTNCDAIRAVIRGTGANHDGTKEGITLPNPVAQADLVRRVYQEAGIEPKDTGYFEAHGTGTKAGDPREAAGIGAVFASSRADPLYVGSIKTNIGHLEGASGLAGVIKAMMSVEKGKILPNMHFNTPNPEIDFDALKIKVPQSVIDWNAANGIRRASVNSFGFGGSNVHVVLENYRPKMVLEEELSGAPARPYLLPFSSHSEKAGAILQKSLSNYLKEHLGATPADIAFSFSTRRTKHQFRAFAVGHTAEELALKTATLQPHATWKRAEADPRLGFIFTGQGAQWYGMGRQLIEEHALFRNVLVECEGILSTLPDAPTWSVVDELTKSETDSRLSQSEFSQPLCTAVQIALVDLLASWNIRPTGVAGHSSGEIAAAYASGALSKRDAIICAYYRGLYMSRGLYGAPGKMMAVELTEAEANNELAAYQGRAGIAAVNSPSSITLSGDEDAILAMKASFDEKKTFARLLQVEQAFHSHHMVPLAPAFKDALSTTDGFKARQATVKMFSSVTGRDSGAQLMDASYWADNMTGRVRFSDAVTGLVLDLNDDVAIDVLIELGPHPALKGPAKQTIKQLNVDMPYIGTLDRKAPAYESLLACAGSLFSLGYDVDLDAVNSVADISATGVVTYKQHGHRLNNLPTYSWDHKSYWSETRISKSFRHREKRTSLLGALVPGSPLSHPRWHNYLRHAELPWLSDYMVDGGVVLPASAFLSMAIDAILEVSTAENRGVMFREVTIPAPLPVPGNDIGVEIMLELCPIDGTSFRFTIYSFTPAGESVINCNGKISTSAGGLDVVNPTTIPEALSRTHYRLRAENFYRQLEKAGIVYGPFFQLSKGWLESGDSSAVAELDTTALHQGNVGDAYAIHPALLESMTQGIFLAIQSSLGLELHHTYVATSFKQIYISADILTYATIPDAKKYWAVSRVVDSSERSSEGSVSVHDIVNDKRLVHIEGMLLTNLTLKEEVIDSSQLFRTVWKHSFEHLAVSERFSQKMTSEKLVEAFYHYWPAGSVLDLTKEGSDGEKHDLIIINRATSEDDIKALLKPRGYVIAKDNESVPGLGKILSGSDFTLWKGKSAAVDAPAFTLLVDSNTTERVRNLFRQLLQGFKPEFVSATIVDLDLVTDEQLARTMNHLVVCRDCCKPVPSDLNQSKGRREKLQQLIKRKSRKLICVTFDTSRDATCPYGEDSSTAASLLCVLGGTSVSHIEIPNPVRTLLPAIIAVTATLQPGESLRATDDQVLVVRIAPDAVTPVQEQEMADFSSVPMKLDLSRAAPVFEVLANTQDSVQDGFVRLQVERSGLVREGWTSAIGTVSQVAFGSRFKKGDKVIAIMNNADAHASMLDAPVGAVIKAPVDTTGFSCIIVPLMQAIYALNSIAHIQQDHGFLVTRGQTRLGSIAASLIRAAGASVLVVVDTAVQRQRVINRLALPLKSVILASELGLVGTNINVDFVIHCGEEPIDKPLADAITDAHVISFTRSQSCDNLTETNVDLAKLFASSVTINRLVPTVTKIASEPDLLPAFKIRRLPYSNVAQAIELLRAEADVEFFELFADGGPVAVSKRNGLVLNRAKTYVVAGEFGQFVWTVAAWLVQAGVGNVVFFRSDHESHSAATWLTLRGVKATVESSLENIASVSGVFCGPHSLSRTSLEAVHNMEQEQTLDIFMCISSIAPELHDAEYNAGLHNFYKRLVKWRRSQRLPASLVSVGLSSDVGSGSAPDNEEAHSRGLGLPTISHFDIFGHLTRGALSQYPGGADYDMDDGVSFSGLRFESYNDIWNKMPKLKLIRERMGQKDTESNGNDKPLLTLIREAPGPEEKLLLLSAAFVAKMASSLSIMAEDIHTGLALSAYGMDSLIAVDFRTWLSNELHVSLALFEILGSSTIKALLQHVCELVTAQASERPVQSAAAKTKRQSGGEENSLVLKPIPTHIPLSSFQRRMWFMDSMMENSGSLTCGFTLSINGTPNLNALKKAIHELGRRNNIFRTRYFEGPDFAQQQVMPTIVNDVEFQDISHEPEATASVQSYMDVLLKRPMDLEKGEVIRTVLLKLNEDKYAWLVATHHITIDGNSRQFMMEQIVTCYNDAVSGNVNTQDDPALSYIDFTLWHEDQLKLNQAKEDLEWWKQVLTGANGTSSLFPFAQNERPEKPSNQRRVIRSKLSNTTLKRMKRVCGGVNATPFHFILAALRAFVFRYTGQEDLTLLVIAGERPHPACERIIGFFVNVIPLRWESSFDEPFESTLSNARDLAVKSMQHLKAPFDEILNSLNLKWNPQHAPLGQIALNYQMYAKSQQYSTTDFDIVDVHVTDVPTSSELQFEVLEHQDDGLGFTLDYDSYLYGDGDMDRFLDNFMAFIESAVQDFRQPVDEITMCGPLEIDALQRTCWTEEIITDSWMHMTLWDRFEHLVKEDADAIAIKTSEGNLITRHVLLGRAIELVKVLHAAGVAKGDHIGVISYAGIDVIAAMLALAYLRCAFVPMDPNNAQGRIEYMIENTSSPVVLHGPDLDPLIANLGKSTKARLVPFSAPVPNTDAPPPAVSISPDDVCYIVYTSGSTGKPKGVMVSHENTQAMLIGRETALSLSSEDIFLSHTSMSFDISMAQTWGSITSGAMMALAGREARSDMEQLVSFTRDVGATMLYMTPTQLAMIVENCLKELGQCKTIRSVSIIGEHLPPRLVRAVYDLKIDGLVIYNEYGPSESTSQNTYYAAPYPDPEQLTVDIGRPLPNSSAYVLDSRLRPVPVGVFGELCIGGPQVSLGYLGRESDAFACNSLAGNTLKEHGWTRLYRTGDMARFRPNGVLDLRGRISGDKQVKLRGHRIDLEEIETEIHRLSRTDAHFSIITSAVVLARTLDSQDKDMTDDRQLVAFIALRTPQDIGTLHAMATKLNSELSNTLNHYMLPSCYQPMEAIPTLVSGKIDRVGLTNMKLEPIFHSKTQVTTSQVTNSTAKTEAPANDGPVIAIRQLFASILKLPVERPVTNNDNFFDLGGQSIMALRLQKNLKKEFSVPVKLVDIFRNPTPGGIQY